MPSQYFVLAEVSDNYVLAVGPFAHDDAASDWAHEIEYEEYLATVRGVVRRVAPSKFREIARED